VRFSKSGYDTLIETPDGTIRLEYQLRYEVGHDRSNIEQIVFADGVLDAQGIVDRSLNDLSGPDMAPVSSVVVPQAPQPRENLIAYDPVAASVDLATDPRGDSFHFTPGNEAETEVYGAASTAQLMSRIAGDDLTSGAIAEAGSGTGSDNAGVLVDPAAADEAFLSATQLAALDDNMTTYY
jgi:hypothetical protein